MYFKSKKIIIGHSLEVKAQSYFSNFIQFFEEIVMITNPGTCVGADRSMT